MNSKRLEALLYLWIHAMQYFKTVQLRIDIIVSHQALQNRHGGTREF